MAYTYLGLVYTVCLYVFVGLIGAQGQIDFRPYNVTAENLFFSSDYNGNGFFDRNELDAVFVSYDVNHDGRVARHEYLHPISAALYDFAVLLFNDYDCVPPEHDGFLDQHDFDAYYLIIDQDDDGQVTKDEFVDHWVHYVVGNPRFTEENDLRRQTLNLLKNVNVSRRVREYMLVVPKKLYFRTRHCYRKGYSFHDVASCSVQKGTGEK